MDLARSTFYAMAESWGMRLMSREMFIPTFAQADFVATSIEPRRAYLRAIIGGIIGRPPHHPLVGRCVLTVIGPCIMLSVISRLGLESLLPDLAGQEDGIGALVDHVERFVFAGLDAAAIASSPADGT